MKRKIAVKCNPIDNIQIGEDGKLTISYTGEFIIEYFSRSGKIYCWLYISFYSSLSPFNTKILAVGVLSGSNTYEIGGKTKIKNYQDEEVDADCSVEDDKIILTMSGGKAGTVQIKRLIKDNKLHVEQVKI